MDLKNYLLDTKYYFKVEKLSVQLKTILNNKVVYLYY